MNRTTRLAMLVMAALGLLLAACGEGTTTESDQLSSDSLGSSVEGTDGETASDNDDGGDAGSADAADDGGQAGTDDAMQDDGTAEDGTTEDGTTEDSDGSDDGDQAQEGGEGTLRSSVLGAALDNTSSMSSARFEGTIEVTGGETSETPGTFTIGFTGAYDEPSEASEISMDMSDILTAAVESDPEAAAGMEIFGALLEDPIQVITIGDKAWVKWGLLALFGVEDQWLETAADESEDLTSEMGGIGGDSPTDLLESLADADAELEELGREDIRGTETTHYRATLDLESLAATMSPEERAEFEADLGASPDGEYIIDLWIDDEELLHRFELNITGIEQTDENDLESMRVIYDIWDHGVDLGIAPPPADQVITEAELGFTLDDFGDITG